jgi:hypothetical protein
VRRLLRLLLRLFYAVAWVLVLCAAALIALEESGVLTRLVRERLAHELGALGPHVHLERARLLWFEPGLVLDGLTFDGERAPGGGWVTGEERVRLSSIHVRLDPKLDPRRPVREVEVRGGRVALSQPLLDAAQALADAGEEGPGPADLPPTSLHGVALELELPPTPSGRTDRLPLGSVDLWVRSGDGGGASLRGRVQPSLGGAVQGPASVVVEGDLGAGGDVRVTAAARGVALDSGGLAAGDAERLFGLTRFRGKLDVDVAARLASGGTPELDLALRVEQADLEHRGELPLEDVAVRADARFAPPPGTSLWHPDAWAATVEAEARYDRSRVAATALVGADARPGSYVEAWARIADLHLDEGMLRALHVEDVFDVVETFRALEPRGSVDVDLAARLPRSSVEPGAPRVPAIAASIVLAGGAAMTYRGWQDEHGVRRGVPIPVSDVRGALIFAHDGSVEQPLRLALVDLSGDHGGGRAHADGIITSRLGGGDTDLDLELRVPEIALDARLGAALTSLEGVRRTWEALAPDGGALSARWRLRRRAELRGVTAVGHVEVRDASLTWREVPVPLTGLVGTIDMRWARRASVVADEPVTVYGERPAHRPVGVLWRVGAAPGAAQPTGLVVSARGLLREAPLEPEVARAEIPRTTAESLEVELGDLLLRGRDWNVLTARFPQVGEEVAELRAQGRIDAAFRGRRPTADARYRYDLEVTARPDEVVLTPRVFRRQTQDVTGRVLWRERDAAPGEEASADGRFHVFGAWDRDVVLASTGVLGAGGGGEVVVLGAGVDPRSPTLRGALTRSLADEEGSEVDLGEFEVDGRLDFEALVHLPAGPSGLLPEPETAYRIFLRDNRFRSETFGLDALSGVLLQERDALSSPRLHASLAGTQVELANVLLLPLATAAGHPRADPRLGQSGFRGGPEGFAFQADWAVADLALDREHLRPFVDEETLDVLLERSQLAGTVDVTGARVLAVALRDGGGRVAFRGGVAPRAVRLSAGLPLLLRRGEIDVRDLVLEAGRLRGWWRIDGLDAEVAGRAVENAEMTMTYVDGRLTIDNLRGSFAGGEVTSLGGGEQADRAIAIDLTEPYAYAVAMRLRDVAVQEVLGGIFSSGADDLGELSASFRLRGRGANVLDLAGNGSIRLFDARLWSIPVVRELFRRLGADATAVFDRMELDWTLERGTLDLRDIRVRSPLLHLVGDGAVELTGEVSSDLQVRYSLVDKLGPLNRIVYWLNNRLWRVAIRGDMGRPVVFVRNSLFELVFGFDEDVPRSLPLPGWRRLPARF